MKTLAALTEEIKYPCVECGGCITFTKEGDSGCNGCGLAYRLEIMINLTPLAGRLPFNKANKEECKDKE